MIRDFTLEAVGVGWRLESTRRHINTDAYQPEPVGGLCVEIAPGHIDPDTGEKIGDRYRCLTRYRLHQPWSWLDADEIDVDQLVGVDRRACEANALWLLRQLFTGRKVARLHGDDIDRIAIAHRLAVAWAQGR